MARATETSRRLIAAARRSSFALLAFVGLAGLAEVALRVAGFERPPPPFVRFHPESERIEASILARPDVSPEANLLWRVRPNHELSLGDGVQYRVNASGLRGPDPSRPKRTGVKRIVVLGESVAFGLGVPEEATFVSRIPEFLGAAADSVEAVNGGVPGYTSFQGRLFLEAEVDAWEPDAVALYFGVANEFHPAALTDRERARGPGAIARFLRRIRILQVLATPPRAPVVEARTVRVPVGEFEQKLEAMARRAREAGALALLVVPAVSPECAMRFPVVRDYPEAVRRSSEREGIALADAAAIFEAHPNAVSLFLDLPHPTIEGHALLARSVAAALERAGF